MAPGKLILNVIWCSTFTLISMYRGTVTGIIQLVRGRKGPIETDDQLDDQKIIDLFDGLSGNGIAL